MTSRITFWSLLNGNIMVQRQDEFFAVPPQATESVKTDASLRQSIAENFDTAPFKQRGIALSGATVLDTIEL